MGAEYRIKARSLNRNLNWRGEKELLCHRCGKKIVAGDMIHRNHNYDGLTKHSKDARFYHLKCWKEMFVSA